MANQNVETHSNSCKDRGGLDVHKDSVFVCILSENGDKFEAKYGVLKKKPTS